MTTIVWLRQDLRVADHSALYEASKLGPVLPVYILDDGRAGDWPLGAASRWWLHHSLKSLAASFEKLGSPLILRRGDSAQQLQDLLQSTGATRVFWNRCYEPEAIAYDSKLKESLKAKGIDVRSFNGSLLAEPWELETKSASFFKVFTPFWKACLKVIEVPEPLSAPGKLQAPARPKSEDLDSWKLLPSSPNWAQGFGEYGFPGEAQGSQVLAKFLSSALERYQKDRDYPALPMGVSHLSPYLHFGEISPRQVWQLVRERGEPAENPFLRQLFWREFSYHLLYHSPQLPTEAFNPRFANFPWLDDEDAFQAWSKGQTGYPIVDAGMRELWQTGWMHNRVRMIVASFLSKHLLIPWQRGARWFWDCLVDADLANNSASWQWVAGSGADAAPYFRIFNPTLQAERFDPDGSYIRRWVPELAEVKGKELYQPNGYIRPLVDHKEARARALEYYSKL